MIRRCEGADGVNQGGLRKGDVRVGEIRAFAGTADSSHRRAVTGRISRVCGRKANVTVLNVQRPTADSGAGRGE